MSIISSEIPRGFMVTLKTDSEEEYKHRGRNTNSIPIEAKSANYVGDYVKIDWIYPAREIVGLGIVRNYFYAVEQGAIKAGYPSIHVDATDNGLSYWSQEKFKLTIPKESHPLLINAYDEFKKNSKNSIVDSLPKKIDPNMPHYIPRIFMEVFGAMLADNGGHLHFYKKF